MKAEELFLAIGEVESSRLTRSELTTARPSGQREQEEPKMKKRNVSRILRNLLQWRRRWSVLLCLIRKLPFVSLQTEI